MIMYPLQSRPALFAAAVAALLLSGCAGPLNTADNSEFACSDRDCPTPFEVYNATNSAPPSVRNGRTPEKWNKGAKGNGAAEKQQEQTAMPALDLTQAVATTVRLQDPAQKTAQPIREPSQVMRIWIAPWIDQGDNLNWSGYVYTEVTPKRWAFGERQIRYQSLAPQFVQPK
ncbi:type IV conjugative transfer system protein TraV (plasmid) [Simplicispira suum]|uniref:Type IV conjugative transfer system protein TraV n=2 Tax=Simplicispira suum TaxID=2109915 RepID=A0A2S0N5L2_9BURK|nr:type IV conjugative transfer system protein TraV [Simplicispira suum]